MGKEVDIWTIQGQSNNKGLSVTLFPEAIKCILKRGGDCHKYKIIMG